jgi:hypothetical protein
MDNLKTRARTELPGAILAVKNTKVFHGSDMLVETPQILQPVRALDFGDGFYTTTNEQQARNFAKKVRDRNGSAESRISVYTLNIDLLSRQKMLFFEKPNKKWLDFVSANRNGTYNGEAFDVIYGPVANDTVFKTFIAYQNGTLNERETLLRLKVRPLYNQLVLKNEDSLKCLSFAGELK